MCRCWVLRTSSKRWGSPAGIYSRERALLLTCRATGWLRELRCAACTCAVHARILGAASSASTDATPPWQYCAIWIAVDDRPGDERKAAAETRAGILRSDPLLYRRRVEPALDSNCGCSWSQHDSHLDLRLSLLLRAPRGERA